MYAKLYPRLEPAHLEAVTLWSFNRVDTWLKSKAENDRTKILEKADSLVKKMDKISKSHSKKVQDEMTRDFEERQAFLAGEEKLSRQHCNLISEHRDSLCPKNSGEYDACRKSFNRRAKLRLNSEKAYLSALGRFLNTKYQTQFLTARSINFSISKAKEAMLQFLNTLEDK